MKKKSHKPSRTREDVHKSFEHRVTEIFRFLIDEFRFNLVPRTGKLDLGREIYVQYEKLPKVGVCIHCTGIFQNVLLQGDTGQGWISRGLHQIMSVRCPDLTIPPGPDAEVESELRAQLEFCAQILRDHFRDFLEGDPSILAAVR